MSTLPSYRARDEEEAFVPLLQSDVENAEQDPEHASKGSSHRPPSYPPPISTGPALGAAAFPAVATPATGTSMVTYHYEPRYPLTGDEVYILGYLGSSKQVRRFLPVSDCMQRCVGIGLAAPVSARRHLHVAKIYHAGEHRNGATSHTEPRRNLYRSYRFQSSTSLLYERNRFRTATMGIGDG